MEFSDETPGDTGLSEVREILFGEARRELAGKLAEVNDRVTREVEALRGELHERDVRWHETLQRELSTLSDKLSSILSEHAGHLRQLSNELAELRSHTDNSLVQLVNNLRGEQSNHAQAQEASLQRLRGDVHDEIQRLTSQMNDAITSLRNDERRTLSGLFSSLAQQIGSGDARGD